MALPSPCRIRLTSPPPKPLPKYPGCSKHLKGNSSISFSSMMATAVEGPLLETWRGFSRLTANNQMCRKGQSIEKPPFKHYGTYQKFGRKHHKNHQTPKTLTKHPSEFLLQKQIPVENSAYLLVELGLGSGRAEISSVNLWCFFSQHLLTSNTVIRFLLCIF